MNNFGKSPYKLHVLFLRFWSYIPFLDTLFPSGSSYIFSDMHIPHCYKFANTPILQSWYPLVSFPDFVSTSQLFPISFFSSALPPPPPFLVPKYHTIPVFMFMNNKPLPHPCHLGPTFFPKDLFISFSGVIYVTPYPINVGNWTFSS